MIPNLLVLMESLMELSILMTMHWGPSSSSNCKNLSTTMRRNIDSPLSLTPRSASPCRSFMGRGKGVRLMARNRLNTKSLYISRAVSNFYGTEIEIWAGFGPVGSTEKKIGSIKRWGRFFHVFILTYCSAWTKKLLLFQKKFRKQSKMWPWLNKKK